MTCVSMILYTQPSPVILDQIASGVQNDRSQNVKSFVVTVLDALSKSPVSAEKQMAEHLKAALKIVKFTPEQMRSSQKHRVPIYVSEQVSGRYNRMGHLSISEGHRGTKPSYRIGFYCFSSQCDPSSLGCFHPFCLQRRRHQRTDSS